MLGCGFNYSGYCAVLGCKYGSLREIGFWGRCLVQWEACGVSFRVDDGQDEGEIKVKAAVGCCIGGDDIDSRCEARRMDHQSSWYRCSWINWLLRHWLVE